MSGKNETGTPVRGTLRSGSTLLPLVEDNLGAMEPSHRSYLVDTIKPEFADSLEVDSNLSAGREQENRWDYLLGHRDLACVIGLEPHSAKDEAVQTVIRKKQRAQEQLRPHFRDGAKVAEWYWVASGKNRFLDTEKTRRLLDQNGIRFVCPQLAPKDLEKLEKQLRQRPQPKRRR
jgi:hypothetical protein